MDHARDRLQLRIFRELGLDQLALADQQKLGVGMPRELSRSAGNNDGRADIATHGVKRDSNVLRHEFPGN
jgi:hypothetical protein